MILRLRPLAPVVAQGLGGSCAGSTGARSKRMGSIIWPSTASASTTTGVRYSSASAKASNMKS